VLIAQGNHMLLLTSTSDAITLVTLAAAAIDVHASWVDNLSGAITPGRTNTATISTITTTTIVASPAPSTQRNIKSLVIRNRHASVACDVTVKHTDGTNNLEIIRTTLQVGEELVYLDDSGGFVQLLAGGAVKAGFDPANVAITGGTIAGTLITTKAGTTAAAGLSLTSGTNKTTPVGGEIEYDGVVSYFTPVLSERGVILSDQIITTQGGTYTLASQTALQKLFNSPSNGALNVGASRTYLFDCHYDLSSMSASSGSFGFGIAGSATLTFIKWWSFANKAALATAASAQSTMNLNSNANTTIVTATTNTVGWAHIRGIIRINASGTIIPGVSLGVAAAAVVGRDSYFRIWPYGTNTVASVGNWT
jgi:hypothetical protein